MQPQADWAEVIRIMVTGFGAVFVIMILLALITEGIGRIFQKFQKREEKEERPS